MKAVTDVANEAPCVRPSELNGLPMCFCNRKCCFDVKTLKCICKRGCECGDHHEKEGK